MLNLRKIACGILLFIVALTPVFSLLEIISLMRGVVVNQMQPETPLAVKIIKDLGLIAVIGLSFIYYFRKKTISSYYLPFLYCLGIVMIAAVLSAEHLMLVAAGLRWAYPFFAVLFLIPFVDEEFLSRMAKLLFYLFIFHFGMQAVQLFFVSQYGFNALGLSLRSPGLFLIPNTAACFSLLCFFYNWFYGERVKAMTLLFLVPASVLLNASGTGLLVLMFIYLIVAAGQRYAKLAVLSLPVFAWPAFQLMVMITGRGEGVFDSLRPRLNLFQNSLERTGLFSSDFGTATNVGVALSGGESGAFSADSMYTTIVANLGVLPFVLFIAVMLIWSVAVSRRQSFELYLFTGIFILFSVTAIPTETFPTNVLMACLLALYLKRDFHFSLDKKRA